MRRSICFCEPNHAFVGQTSNWKFIYTTAIQLSKGAKLRFDFESKGREIDWEIPQPNAKGKGSLFFAELPNGKTITPSQIENPETKTASFEFTLPLEVKPAETITFHLKESTPQKTVQRRRPFHLSIDPKGKKEFKENETFFLDVRGGALNHLKVIAPSLVARNKRFDVIVRFEDQYGNLTSNAPEGTLIDLSYEHLRENLNWKLFVPETGFIALPNLYFNEPGIYRIQLKNLKNKQHFFSPPIKCLPEGALSLYWGLLHSESLKVDSMKQAENFLRHMRDDRALQFFATSCFDSEEETSSDAWKELSNQVAEFNEEDRFVVFAGFQWLGDPKEEGLRHFIYSKDMKPILRKKETKSNSLKKIYKTSQPKELITIPSMTMGNSTLYSFDDFQPEFEKVVEIYNAWGSSECTTKEGNLRPISGNKKGLVENDDGSIRKALNRGKRFGFTAGGMEHRSIFRSLLNTSQTEYSPGLTAILAKEHNRSSLFEALQNRSCYATTGEKIILGFHIAGQSMGSELNSKQKPGLVFNRHITGYAIGTSPMKEALLIRNGKPFRSLEIQKGIVEFEVDDMDPLGDISLKKEEDSSLFTYYYLRVTQEDGHIAWSSPIWIDVSEKTSQALSSKKGKKKA